MPAAAIGDVSRARVRNGRRALWLSGAYAVVLVFGWPVLAMVGLGLADAIFGFRQRYLQRNTPPAPVS